MLPDSWKLTSIPEVKIHVFGVVLANKRTNDTHSLSDEFAPTFRNYIPYRVEPLAFQESAA